MKDKLWRWLAIGLVVANVAYWVGWQGWQWKLVVDARLGGLEAAVIAKHPELVPSRPPEQPEE